jgi:hypothetical protein
MYEGSSIVYLFDPNVASRLEPHFNSSPILSSYALQPLIYLQSFQLLLTGHLINSYIMTSDLSPATIISALPLLFGVAGTSIGIYSFVSPYNAIRLFGLQSTSTEKAISSHSEAFQKSIIYASGLRNIGTGLSTLGLFAFWQFSPICQVSPLAAAVTKRCMGICFIFGSLVGIGDAVIVRRFANQDYIQGETEEKATKASISHAVTGVVILATGLFIYL